MLDLFSNEWANALGWALLHSLWQSLIILLIVVACLRFIPTLLSKVRYAVTCAGFLLTLLTSLFTFNYLINQNISNPDSWLENTNGGIEYFVTDNASIPAFEHWLLKLTLVIESHMAWIVAVWMIGFLIFSARFYCGFFYTNKLRTSAIPLQNEWSEYIQLLCNKLGINRLIILAESAEINSPVVMGYFKPIILLPVGMLTGLTTEQLETIFLHEIAHIKRHDFLVNLFQSFVETLFFFNPCIWSLSNLIRREREFCCDDLVIHHHQSPLAYAHALTQLEEIRLSKNTFVLSLAENKNQLLNRIKRIMERSVKNYSGKGRMIIPVILLMVGLLCASWLSIQEKKGYKSDSLVVEQDTSIRKNIKSARYSRRKTITVNEDGVPHEEISEEFEGEEGLRLLLSEMDPPSPPGVSFFIPPMVFQPTAPLLPSLDIDTIPDSLPGPEFHLRPGLQWEEFSKAFEEKFKGRFEDFYSSHETELSKIMKELQEKFQSQDWPELGMSFEDLNIAEEGFQQAQRAQQEALKNLKELENQNIFKNLQENMKRTQEVEMENFRNLELDLKIHDDNFRKYEQDLRERLIEDGYLSENEAIKSMEWNDESYKINGNPIKESDKKKYNDLQEKYLGEIQYFRKVE